jgi:adenosylmethionine-8-amino-7-oxononanoate aminotransferase
MFACEHESVKPDLLCVAKGLSGGYLPLAATLATDRIYRGFLGDFVERRTFFHGHTYTGNPLCCAAALASLDVFKKEKVLERLKPKIRRLSRRLRVLRSLPHVGDVRQRGFFAGIELVKERRTKEPYAIVDRIGAKVTEAARADGVLLRPLGDVIVICPPLSITMEQMDRILDVIERQIGRFPIS